MLRYEISERESPLGIAKRIDAYHSLELRSISVTVFHV